MNGKRHDTNSYSWQDIPNVYEDDSARLRRIIASRPKPPPRVLIGRWLFRLMVAALVIQTLIIIWLKWDSSICRALLIS